MQKTHRAQRALKSLLHTYPQLPTRAREFLRLRSIGAVPCWPVEWCYMPLHAVHAMLWPGEGPFAQRDIAHLGISAALLAWRQCQTIIRYDPVLYQSVLSTQLDGEIPTEILFRLPAWCVYVETPDLVVDELRLHGFWAHLDWDEAGPPELRLVLDAAEDPRRPLDGGLVSVPLLLGTGGLRDAFERLAESANQRSALCGHPYGDSCGLSGERIAEATRQCAPILALVLYLCAENADWGGPVRPSNPRPNTSGHTQPAHEPRVWDVGVRLGSCLRRAYHTEQVQAASGSIGTQRPSVRRAHWHMYRIGPRKRADGTRIPPHQQQHVMRWLPPIPVGIDDLDTMPVVIRPIA